MLLFRVAIFTRKHIGSLGCFLGSCGLSLGSLGVLLGSCGFIVAVLET